VSGALCVCEGRGKGRSVPRCHAPPAKRRQIDTAERFTAGEPENALVLLHYRIDDGACRSIPRLGSALVRMLLFQELLYYPPQDEG